MGALIFQIIHRLIFFMKKDIEGREDVIKLVDAFFEKAEAEDLLGKVFNRQFIPNFIKHKEGMYNFWENVLFYSPGYSGNPMKVHAALHEKTPLTKEHFVHWVKLFNETLEELFEGEKANLARLRAESISIVMQIKILS